MFSEDFKTVRDGNNQPLERVPGLVGRIDAVQVERVPMALPTLSRYPGGDRSWINESRSMLFVVFIMFQISTRE
jgi:hypothetical protein